MFCHDATDFLLATAKLCKYNRWEFWASLWYFAFVIGWIGLRICLFGYKVLYSLYAEAHPYYSCHWMYLIFSAKLSILFLLHCYWTKMILITAVNAVKGNELEDIRSDDDEKKPKRT